MPVNKNPIVYVDTDAQKDARSRLSKGARKALLLYFGVLATAIEETYDFVGRLVEHGEIAEQEGRKLLHDVIERRKQDARKAEHKASEFVEGAGNRLAPSSKADIVALDKKVAELSRQIDAINNP